MRSLAGVICLLNFLSCGPENTAKQYLSLLTRGQLENAEALLEPATAAYLGQDGLKGTYPDLVTPGKVASVHEAASHATVTRVLSEGVKEAGEARTALGDLLHTLILRKTSDGWRVLDCAAVGYVAIKQVGMKQSERATTGVAILEDGRCDDNLVPKLEAWLLSQHGEAYYDQGVYEKATEALQRSLQLDPKAETHAILGYVYRDNKAITNNATRAIDEFSAAVRMSPNESHYHAALADAYREAGNLDGALVEFETALHIDPSDTQTHYFYARSLLQKERVGDAIEELKTVVAADPNYRDAAQMLNKAVEYKLRRARQAAYLRALRGWGY